jgi:hypothetical protein
MRKYFKGNKTQDNKKISVSQDGQGGWQYVTIIGVPMT